MFEATTYEILRYDIPKRDRPAKTVDYNLVSGFEQPAYHEKTRVTVFLRLRFG
jgi:hypothetical protein